MEVAKPGSFQPGQGTVKLPPLSSEEGTRDGKGNRDKMLGRHPEGGEAREIVIISYNTWEGRRPF